MLKMTLLSAALAAALVGNQARAGDAHSHHCLDEGCTLLSLIDAETTARSGASTPDVIAATSFGQWGIDVDGMDRSVKPGDDFFAYVNGGWAKRTAIPADRSNFGSFAALRDLSEARVRALLESYPLGNPVTDGDAAKIAALYRGFMDEERIEALGGTLVQGAIEQIAALRDKTAFADYMGREHAGFAGTLFSAFVGDDQRNPDVYALYLGQSGLGLGDRELYLDPKFAPQRERYQQYVAQMLTLAKWPNPAENAAAIMAMETRIAQAHWTRAQSRDRDKTYNPVALADFANYAPGFPWATWFKAAGIDHADKAVVRQNTALPAMAAIFNETPLDTLKAWQAFHTLDSAAPLLSSAYAKPRFEFRDKFLSGQPEERPRWKRAVAYTESAMGEAIGRDYVGLYFPSDAKAKMDALVANVRAAMAARLDALTWMGDATKQEARAKLANFGLKIGHPATWRDYSGLTVINGDVVGNALRAGEFEWNFRRARIGKPVDKAEWGMTPQTVNAYYNAVKNEIVFPAAILQPPFFDPSADPAVNYGAIAGVIGHEITHGFDDQGRKSDGKGMLRDWWTAEDAAKFEAQATRLGAQYESYVFPTLPGMKINGRVSMGENIADLGGLSIALEAYRRSLGGKPAPVIDGFTGEQRFFMGWAQVWRILWRDDALRQQLVNGPHSPGQIRAFAPMRNIDAWYEAFNVKPGEAQYIAPEQRVRIW